MLDLFRLALGGGIITLGLVMMLVGAIGVLRFPDFYTRLHAGAVDTYGAAVVALGLAITAPDFSLGVRLLLLSGFLAAMAPALTHMLGNAAHAGGLSPIAGAYVAPRPGARGARAP
ncbi:MAG: monovalent cation/H(+) antiporter subunit G [Hyphomonadaceae bacterium]